MNTYDDVQIMTRARAYSTAWSIYSARHSIRGRRVTMHIVIKLHCAFQGGVRKPLPSRHAEQDHGSNCSPVRETTQGTTVLCRQERHSKRGASICTTKEGENGEKQISRGFT